jgi:plastocyanin
MKQPDAYRRLIGIAVLALGLLAMAPRGWADDATTVKLTIKDHKFQPAEVSAPAGKPIALEIANQDPTPAEFESKALRVEKIIAGNGTATIQVRALAAGRYRFFDDYHAETTQGVLVVQ